MYASLSEVCVVYWRFCIAVCVWRPSENCILCPAVPPSPPLCRIPSSVTTGKMATMSCHDSDGSPPSKYQWYKDGTLLPTEPHKNSAFKNATYKLNTITGNLVSLYFAPSFLWQLWSPWPLELKIYPVCLLRSFPMQPRWTLVNTTVRLSTMLVLLSAVKARKWKSVSALLFHLKKKYFSLNWFFSFLKWNEINDNKVTYSRHVIIKPVTAGGVCQHLKDKKLVWLHQRSQ